MHGPQIFFRTSITSCRMSRIEFISDFSEYTEMHSMYSTRLHNIVRSMSIKHPATALHLCLKEWAFMCESGLAGTPVLGENQIKNPNLSPQLVHYGMFVDLIIWVMQAIQSAIWTGSDEISTACNNTAHQILGKPYLLGVNDYI